jgi:hypothetical protein
LADRIIIQDDAAARGDARPSAGVKKLAVMAHTLNGHKVAVDPLGRAKRASD